MTTYRPATSRPASGRPASRLRRIVRCRPRGDDGFAMITVIGTMMVLTLLVAIATFSATGSIPAARADQDSQSALAAAEAGVDDYVARLNLNGAYYTLQNTDPSNPALSTTSFAPVPGRVGQGEYRYQILTPTATVASTGSLELEVVGRSRAVQRTVRVTINKASFLDYMYFTEFETLDPLNTPDPAANGDCASYSWASPARRTSCAKLVWADGDGLKGPVHSNDTILVNGSPVFQAEVDTGWNDPLKAFWKAYAPTDPGDPAAASPINPSFPPGNPRYRMLTMPPTNGALRDQAALGNGCLYSGPTSIVFSGTSMQVTSPFTTTSSAACGSFSATSTPAYTATVPVPDGKVVFVESAPADCSTPASVAKFAAVGYPIAGDDSHNGVTPLLGYSCSNGDAFVEGTVDGRVSVGTENNVIVTQNLTYAGSDDILGLAAANFVQLYRPITCGTGATDREPGTNRCRAGTDVPVTGRYPWINPVVRAAVLSTAHAFFLQNWRLSGLSATPTSARDMGTLFLTGGIAQRFRGPMISYNTDASSPWKCMGVCGYKKDYTYDARLKFAPPPYLADMAAARWGVANFSEARS